jgi:ribosome-binding protein aMBF1 (putative translation factor)
MLGLTVDEFAAKLGLTTEMLVSNLDITVAQMAENLGLTNEQLAAKLGLTVTDLNSMMGLTIQELAANMGLTLPALAEQLGTTTAGLVGDLDMTMAQFAGRMGLTVEDLAEKFGLSAESLADKLGMTYQDLMNPFGASMSATVDALKALEEEYINTLAGIQVESEKAIEEVNNAMDEYQKPSNEQPEQNKTEEPKPQNNITVGGRVNAGSATIYADSYGGGAGKQYYASDPIYTVLRENNGYVLVRHHKLKSGYTGWFKKSDLKAYASGTLGTNKDQLAWIDELGLEELVMHAGPNGRLQYLTKGTSVIPHDITENLMQLGQLDPSEVLKRSTPQIGMAPSVVNNEVNITMEIAEVVHIDHVDHDTLPDLTKVVRKEMDSYLTRVNSAIRSKAR